jgi:hypothetical protein
MRLYIYLALLTTVTLGIEKSLQFVDFACVPGKAPAVIGLSNHFELKISTSFTISFWFQYKDNSGSSVFSLRSGSTNMALLVGPSKKLKFGVLETVFPELWGVPVLTDAYKFTGPSNWHFISFAAKFSSAGQKSTMEFKLIQDGIVGESMTVDTAANASDLKVVFGSNENSNSCEISAQYHQVYIVDEFVNSARSDLMALIGGFIRPIFLSVFSREGSYTKWYSNLIRAGAGEMLNGLNPDSFGVYTGLGTNSNPLGRQFTLANDLSVYILPKNLLTSSSMDASYVFVMHFEFYYKDYFKIDYDNVYYHVLYQRIPQGGDMKVIRADLKMNFGLGVSSLTERYFVNGSPVKQELYSLQLEGLGNTREVKFGFIMIQVVNHNLINKPRITFLNGYSNAPVSFSSDFPLNSSDSHSIGDYNPLDGTRKELLSFVSVSEVAFYRGSFISASSNSSATSAVPLLTDSFSKNGIYLTCANKFPPQRFINQSSSQVVLDACNTSAPSSDSKVKSLLWN